IGAQISAYPDVRVVTIVAPDSLASLVSNMNAQRCANGASTNAHDVKYRLSYSVSDDSTSIIDLYLCPDAGHTWMVWVAH
ncbi:uncharacterized protein EI90DRAFT_2923080, partial [Cantharellus anzutake]|uniref:uncharacterized protein n=1 Tax=Cantharellus anzutake TaxID=1750568 RepID=UPI001906B1D7